MEYLKINGVDYSHLVNTLNVSKTVNYTSQTNAAGNSVVDYINSKYSVEVGFIPMVSTSMENLLTAVDNFNITLAFLEPKTGAIRTINCIVSDSTVEYYTIQDSRIMYNALTLEFTEL